MSFGTHFHKFYVSAPENKVFNAINKPNIYLRYADDILLTNSTDEIKLILETFQNIYVPNFTQQIKINNKIPFFGVLIVSSNIYSFTTSTYKYFTNINRCTPNFHIAYPFCYKRTIIKKKTYF